MTSNLRLYAQRDTYALSPHFERHMLALTSEGLTGKAAIARELAYRDSEIERLTALLDAVRKCPAFMCDPCEKCAALLATVADPRGVRGVDWDQNDSPAETILKP